MATERDRLSIDDAMQALGVTDPDARQWSQEIADTYHQIASRDEYRHKVKFSDLRRALREEAAEARGLARRMEQQTERLQALLEHFSKEGASQEAAIYHRRWDMIQHLDSYAKEIAGLDGLPWPKGGKGDLLKARFGAPKAWLVWRCIQVFFRYRREISTKVRSPFRDYVHAIYEAATGEDAEAHGIGLDKVIDSEVRKFRRQPLP